MGRSRCSRRIVLLISGVVIGTVTVVSPRYAATGIGVRAAWSADDRSRDWENETLAA